MDVDWIAKMKCKIMENFILFVRLLFSTLDFQNTEITETARSLTCQENDELKKRGQIIKDDEKKMNYMLNVWFKKFTGGKLFWGITTPINNYY